MLSVCISSLIFFSAKSWSRYVKTVSQLPLFTMVIKVQGGSNVMVGGEQKIVLEATDFLSVTSSLANSADVIVSVLEIT